MPPLSNFLAFSAMAMVLIAIPGPNVLFVISRALAYGRRVALSTAVGGTAGAFSVAVLVSIGIGAVVQASAGLYTVIKIVGAAYLVFLGVRALRHRRVLATALVANAPTISDRRTFLEGFVVGVTNPKPVVFFAAVLPQFAEPAAGAVIPQMLVLAGVFALLALMMDATWGLAAGAVRSWFARSARRLEWIGGAAGLTMIGLGVGLAVSGRKD